MADSKLQIIITAKDQASKELTNLQKNFGKLGNLATGALKIGVGAAAAVATASIAGISLGLKFAIDEALEAQEVMAQLDAVIASTGGAAGMTAEEVGALADSLTGVTRFTDEAIISVETLLLGFDGMSQEIIEKATPAILDMATRLSMDLPTATKMFGKALQDPIEGVAALSRAGVKFSEEQMAALEGIGTVAGQQQFVLDILATKFAGAAEASGKTYAGQMEILKNQLSNVAEGVGTAILPVLSTMLTTLTPYITDLANQLSEFVQSEEFQQWVKDTSEWIKNDMVPQIKDLVQGMKDFAAFFASPEWRAAMDALNAMNDWSEKFVKIQFPNIFAGLGKALWSLITGDVKGAMVELVKIFDTMITGIVDIIANILAKVGAEGILDSYIKGLDASFGEMYKLLGADAQGNALSVPTSSSTVNNWNLTVNSNASSENIISDFGMLQAWGGTP